MEVLYTKAVADFKIFSVFFLLPLGLKGYRVQRSQSIHCTSNFVVICFEMRLPSTTVDRQPFFFSGMGARSQVDYLILKPQLPIHRRPSTSSRTLGQLKRGQIVSGWPQESWLLLAEKGTTPKSTTGGWVLVDASCLGLGQQAQAQWPVPKELRPFSEAVVVEWTKFPARHVEYQVEWADESEKDKITVARSRETMTMARVHELPADSRLIFRLTAKVYTAPPEQGGEIFTEAVGPWEEAETGATIEKLEEGNLCCLADCRGFVGGER